MAAVAILKNPSWARSREQPTPALVGEQWEERPDNPRTMVIWEHFDRDAILAGFYETLQQYVFTHP